MVKDLIFDDEANKVDIDTSDLFHVADVVEMAKGWNKFFPQIGVDIFNYLSSPQDAKTTMKFENDVRKNLTVDTAVVDDVITSEGIQNAKIYAEYNG